MSKNAMTYFDVVLPVKGCVSKIEDNFVALLSRIHIYCKTKGLCRCYRIGYINKYFNGQSVPMEN
jgi:hypothetical protein